MRDYGNYFKGKRALITGGLGFIGSNLARTLVELEADISLVDSLIPEYGGNLFNIDGIQNSVRVNISDVRDPHSMQYLVRERDLIFNLAGQTSHLDSMENPEADLAINCSAQLSILEMCRKHNPNVKVIFASTRQIYGKPQYLPVDERHPLNPVDINGIHKMAGEFYHILYYHVYGIRTCVLRLTNTIGPRMRVKDARQTFVGLWVRQLLENQSIEVWDGNQLRDFTYVDDAVEALLLAAATEEVNGQVFNLGGDCVISLGQLAEILVEMSGGGQYIVCSFPTTRKRIDIGDYYADFSRIRSALGWEPRTTLRQALALTLAFYRENLKHYI